MQSTPFTQRADAPLVEMHELEGHSLPVPLFVHELLWGEKAVLVEMSAPAGFLAVSSCHEHESLVSVVLERIRATVEDETRELGPGDAGVHVVEAAHHIEALVDTRWIEIQGAAKCLLGRRLAWSRNRRGLSRALMRPRRALSLSCW